jgi:hypothetical protein
MSDLSLLSAPKRTLTTVTPDRDELDAQRSDQVPHGIY